MVFGSNVMNRISNKSMNKSYPCIKVCDIETTINWYEHFLGFTCSYKSSIQEPDYAIVENEGVKIYLAKDPNNESYASNIIVIEIADIDASFKKVNDAGAIIKNDIGESMFGGKEFAIKDYEDNTIIYRQHA